MISDSVPARKPPKVRGVASIQLDGETVARVENFVSPRMLGSLAYLGDRYLIAPRSASTTPAGTSLLGGSVSPFSGMVLTDFDREPQPENEIVIAGNALAGGAINAAASGNRRGNFNVPESRFEAGYQRLVWDFATNQANGTFQSIYLFPGNVSPSTGAPTADFPIVASSGASGTSWRFTLHKDGDWYYFTSNGALYRADVNDVLSMLGGYSYGSSNLGALPGIATFANAGAFVKDGVAYWTQNSSPYNIRSAPVTDLASFTNIRTHPAGGNYAGTNNGCSISYWAEADGWIVGNNSSNNPWAIAKLHNDFSNWEVYGTAGSSSATGLSPCWGSTTTETYITTGGGVYAVSDVDSTLKQVWWTTGSSSFAFYPVTPNLGITGSSSSISPTVSSMFFSRALLEEPVTKTNVNTMKITYELTWS